VKENCASDSRGLVLYKKSGSEWSISEMGPYFFNRVAPRLYDLYKCIDPTPGTSWPSQHLLWVPASDSGMLSSFYEGGAVVL
jgi:hypothetical protein